MLTKTKAPCDLGPVSGNGYERLVCHDAAQLQCNVATQCDSVSLPRHVNLCGDARTVLDRSRLALPNQLRRRMASHRLCVRKIWHSPNDVYRPQLIRATENLRCLVAPANSLLVSSSIDYDVISVHSLAWNQFAPHGQLDHLSDVSV